MSLKRILAICAVTCFAATSAVAQKAPPYVAFTAIVEHPALDAVREGALEELAKLGYASPATLRTSFESAQGQPANAVQIANRLVGQRADVIVAIATPSAQAALGATREIPIVFSAVTDPVAAKLVVNLAKPGGNITGVTDAVSVEEHIAFARTVVPQLKKLGVVYNPGEANSVALIDKLRVAAKAAGVELVESPANKTSDLAAATERLAGKVDALYVPTDNVVASGLEAIVGIARQHKMPTIGGDNSFVKRGVMAAGGGFDYRELGRLTGRMVAEILRGRKPGDIPVTTSTNLEIMVNLDEAKRIGFVIPPAVVARAKTKLD